jgi:hypothetical protein
VNNPPRGQSQRTGKAKNRQPKPVDIDALEREIARLRLNAPGKRAWSRSGALEVIAWLNVYFPQIAPGVRTNHRHYHRRKHKDECGAMCEARDGFAVIWLGFEAAPSRRPLPLLTLIIPQIEQLYGVRIREPAQFYRDVWRDLVLLRKALAVRPRKRTEAESAFVRRYRNAASLIQHGEARNDAPATSTD